MSLDKGFYRALRADIEQGFAAVVARHGLASLKLGTIKVDAMGGFRATVTGLQAGGLSEEAQFYNVTREYSERELPELGATVTIGAQQWQVTGQKTRGGQKIIATKVPQGGSFVLPLESFESRFPRKPGQDAPTVGQLRRASAPI